MEVLGGKRREGEGAMLVIKEKEAPTAGRGGRVAPSQDEERMLRPRIPAPLLNILT